MFNKNNFFKILWLPAVVCILTTSCKKYIYQAPINSTYSEEFWKSETSVEQAALAMYGQLRTDLRANRSYFINGDLTAGLVHAAYGGGWWNYSTIAPNNPYGSAFDFSYVPYLESTLQNWSRFYQLIAQCNLILSNVPQMETSLFSSKKTKDAYLGEALFMKAYAYFYMVRVWGDPVYVSQTYDDVDYGNIPALPRVDENIVLDSCLSNLTEAAGYLDYTGGDPTKAIRANKGSVYALMAHIYAWKHEYDKAHTACMEVINNGGYSLEPISTYTNIWNDQSSSENIFSISMLYDANDPNFTNQTDWAEAKFDFFRVFTKGVYNDNRTSSAWVSPKGGFIDQFMDTATDGRYKAAFARVNSSGGDDAGYLVLKYNNFTYQDAAKKAYPYYNNNLVLLRLSDIYLLDAEAQASLGNIEAARSELKKTEQRAGITSYQYPANTYDMLDEIIIERGRELIGEGQWFYDLIRTNEAQEWLPYIGYQSDRVTPDQKGYYWPLDMGTLVPQDNLLVQNPYWATHQ